MSGKGKAAPKGPSQAELLLKLAAKTDYWYGVSRAGEPFAVAPGECVVRTLRGGRGSVRAELARMYAEEHGRAPSAGALADTLLTLEGKSYAGPECELHIRTARTSSGAWLDPGTPDGELIRITPGEWKRSPSGGPLFRRTRLTGPLPEPDPAGDLSAIRELLRISDDDWPLVAAWLVAVLLLPSQPVPVLALTAEQGCAKSWQTRLLVSLADASDCPLRTAPKDIESWTIAAAASRVVALDNLSKIEPWLSDALCRGVTGDGLVKRALYTDQDVSVIAFRRAILINGITLGNLRGDLADRLIRVGLERISDADRQDETALAAKWEAIHPAALGGLLNLAAGVLGRLPEVRLDGHPRMADFARVLAAVDAELRTDGLAGYLAQRESLSAEVVEGDAVATAVSAWAGKLAEPWTGTAAQLEELIRPPYADDYWPRSARAMAARLVRCAPALRATGTQIDQLPQQPGGRRQPQKWRISTEGQDEKTPGGGDEQDEKVPGERPGRTDVPDHDVSAGQDSAELVHKYLHNLGGDVPDVPDDGELNNWGETYPGCSQDVPDLEDDVSAGQGHGAGQVHNGYVVPAPSLADGHRDDCPRDHERYGPAGTPCPGRRA